MAKPKKKSGRGSKVLVVIIGAFLLLYCAAGIFLYAFGDVAPARDISYSRRSSGRQDEASDGKNYRFDVSYTYTADGADYDGLDTGVRGEWLGPDFDATVHYLPFAPRISSMYAEGSLSLSTAAVAALGITIILFAVLPPKKYKPSAAVAQGRPADPQQGARQTDDGIRQQNGGRG